MEPWKVLIADDETAARELILFYLKEWEGNIIVKECSDGNEAHQALKTFQPDIIFMDIKMPGKTGIEVLQNKGPALHAVIFTTAYDNYALPAFELEAVDYLLKPFEKERFNKALKRAIEYLELIKTKTGSTKLQHIPVKIGSKTDLVPAVHVIFFHAEGPYVHLFFQES
jgi:two-component system LytT family response regulator